MVRDWFYVDKTGIIEIMNAKINTMNRYICITKLRRLGKTNDLPDDDGIYEEPLLFR